MCFRMRESRWFAVWNELGVYPRLVRVCVPDGVDVGSLGRARVRRAVLVVDSDSDARKVIA